MRIVVIWIKQGKAYLPTQAQTEAGYYLGIEPIYIANLTKEDMTIAIEKVLATGHPRVSTITREEFRHRKDPLLAITKSKSWKDFENDAIAFTISWTEDKVVLNITDKSSKFQHDLNREHIFPPETPLDMIVESILKT